MLLSTSLAVEFIPIPPFEAQHWQSSNKLSAKGREREPYPRTYCIGPTPWNSVTEVGASSAILAIMAILAMLNFSHARPGY